MRFEPPSIPRGIIGQSRFKPLFKPPCIYLSSCDAKITSSSTDEKDVTGYKDIFDNIPTVCHLKDVSEEINHSMEIKNANPHFFKGEWVGTELEELFHTDPDTFKNLDLTDITHFRRLGSGLNFEFLCVWKNGENQLKITWQRYVTIREHPRFHQLVHNSQWDPQMILYDERGSRVLHYELFSNLKPTERRRAHDDFSKYPSTSQEDCIYCVKRLN